MITLRLTASTAVLAIAGCAMHGHDQAAAPRAAGMPMMARGGGSMATADLQPTRGNGTRGVVTFHQQGAQVMAHVRLQGLKANAEHGFHVHEKGDCSSGDGMSAGGHFNPGGKPHGRHGAGEHHAGDLPSLRADASGAIDTHLTLTGVTVGDGGSADIVGRGLIVHADPDDYRTQPTGNAGARIACALIVRVGMR